MTQLNCFLSLSMSILVALTALLIACSDYQQARSAYVTGEYAKALHLFQVLADSGDNKAQFDLSLMYIQEIGTKKNIDQGLAWLSRAAEKGNVAAMLELGVLYQKIDTLENASQLAFYWFEKASLAGSAVGQYNLAHIYMDGKQTKADLMKAFIWMSLSDSSGNPLAGPELTMLGASLSSREILSAQEKIAIPKKDLDLA